MKIQAGQLQDARFHVLYLFGEDEDGLRQAAEAWLLAGEAESQRLRLDLAEWARFVQQIKSQPLFGKLPCRAMIRDAHRAKASDANIWQELAGQLRGEDRLLLCAAGPMHKKSWHKALLADAHIACCEFQLPDAASFEQWLWQALQHAGIRCARDDAMHMAARLHGMWQEARQWITRLQCYQGDDEAPLPLTVMLELCGEHAPDSLDAWCHAVLMRESQALLMTHQLICHQQTSGLQMLAWLDHRLQQLLLYCWHQARRHPNPARAARLFGSSRRSVMQAARCWKGNELIDAVQALSEAEQALKGGVQRAEHEIMEALVMRLAYGQS